MTDLEAVYEKLVGVKTADEVKSILSESGCKLTHVGGDKSTEERPDKGGNPFAKKGSMKSMTEEVVASNYDGGSGG